MQSVAEDPFAALYEPQAKAKPPRIQTELYISGRLTLLRVPSWMNPGTWVRFPDNPTHNAWHRRLDAHGFLWLRSAVRTAIESGRIAESFSDAPERLEHIAAIGIADGVFTAEDIADHREAPAWFSFNSELPNWADDIGPDFLPPVARKPKPALTARRR